LFSFLVIVTLGPATIDTSSVVPLSDLTTCPGAILSRVTAFGAIIAFVTPPSAMRSVMSPLVPPPARPGPAITARIVPKRKAISNPVESLVTVETSEPASTTLPSPPAWLASTLPWTIVAGTSVPSPISRCSYAPRL
jgi:hypothetical protein